MNLAKSLNLNTYRFSIEWSRIEPKEGEFNLDALERYLQIVLACEKNGLLPMVTLHHFTNPKWFIDLGGFSNTKAPDYFMRYVKLVVDKIGAHVPLWCTINEPMVFIVGSYLSGMMPPGEVNIKDSPKAIENLLRCHALAYDHIHEAVQVRTGPFKDHPLMVGFAHNVLRFKSVRRTHPIDFFLKKWSHRYYNLGFLHCVLGKQKRMGIPFLVPYTKPVEELQGSKPKLDFIGINYYTKCYLEWKPNVADAHYNSDFPVGIHHARPKEKRTDMEWSIHPHGLKTILKALKRYDYPVYITENGLADKKDKYRPEFIVDHLKSVAKAIEYGTDVRGYYHWSLLDNFEWVYGYGPRFGLFHVNYQTQERTERRSARLYRKIIEVHQQQIPNKKHLDDFASILMPGEQD